MIREIKEVKDRKLEIEKKLQVIENAINKELEKPFFQRSVQLCKFLDAEKKIYAAVLSQLVWIINEKT